MMQVSVKNNSSNNESLRFLSLKWKILLLSSVILLVVIVSFCIISYLDQMSSFENNQDRVYQRHEREVALLIKNSSQSLRQIVQMIPFLDSMSAALRMNNGENVKLVFDQHWPLLQFHNGVEFVRFYSKSSQLIASWGVTESGVCEHNTILDCEEDVMHSWVNNVNQSELPFSSILCKDHCMQLIIAPLLVEGKSIGVVAMGASLADVVLRFRNMSAADIGLFIVTEAASSNYDDTLMNDWGVRVVALTNKKANLEILQQAMQLFPDYSGLEAGVEFDWSNRYQQIKSFPLLVSAISAKAYFVIITDVTLAVKNIHESIIKIALIGLFGLIFSEILLFIILTRSLSSLKSFAFALPLLAKTNFGKFRSSLLLSKQNNKFNDEVDVLYSAAEALSHQLEQLTNKVNVRTKLLVEQRDELSKERDFVSNLLDTAQVIVLTQNTRGKILTLNAHGEMLLQYGESELQGIPYIGILALEDETEDLSVSLEEICLGQREQFRHEAKTNCKDGSIRQVIWLHSRLVWHSENDPAVLSVGLDITEYKRVEGNLAWLADHDPLTNLFNRRRFSEELEKVLSLADRYERPGALLFFDLDRFKYVNDTSGHQAGDALLKMVADMLSKTIRTNDITGRLGGDEFAIILPEIKAEDAIEVAKKILVHLDKAELTISGRTHKISASIGIALFPEHGCNVHDLLAIADLAMYQAKDTGRGAWHLFSEADRSRERMHTLVHWKEKIEYAHLHDNFLLYLQPIVSLKTKQIVYYEVLLRMRDKDGLILSPDGFIPAAEHTGLIHAIDHMVLRKAIELAANVNIHGSRDVKFSINLSAHAFNDPELLPTIKRQLDCHDIDPGILIFEITETAALQDLPGARSLMVEIKELGCGFVLDDFGVGFSSFYYLRELPVDTIKIDGSFIRNLVNSKDDQILVRALCSVARGFNKTITAEFVENEETLAMLETMDIDYVQGYFIGKPASYIDYFQDESKSDL